MLHGDRGADALFEHLDRDDHENGSAERYAERVKVHRDTYGNKRRHLFWWLVHNCVAHPLIGVLPIRATFDFHDWTSRRINAKD